MYIITSCKTGGTYNNPIVADTVILPNPFYDVMFSGNWQIDIAEHICFLSSQPANALTV